MSKGIALTIGLNSIDPEHYGGWSGDLNSCELDANEMTEIAKSTEFKTEELLTKKATRSNVINEILKASKSLKPGDILLLVYSGHGGQIPDLNNEENDYWDETWCLYDGELIDDELYHLFGKFEKGIRIVVFSDSCHSGTVLKAAYYRGIITAQSSNAEPQKKFMPRDICLRTYRQNKEFYNKILKDSTLKEAPGSVKASVMLISGCQDSQYSLDGISISSNSLFTDNLLQVWNNGNFKGNYKFFHKKILKNMPPDQTPNYFWVGERNSIFENQIPFTI